MAEATLHSAAVTRFLAIALIVSRAAAGQTPAALRADISYLASDALEGRATPSPGLEMAADYIAAQFRKAGLEPQFQKFPLKRGGEARNVAAILKGSDPELQNEYVILSAHYDHMGHGFPGANDNASGTASVMEIAAALASREGRPKRSILFLAFAGEEAGLLGSNWYVDHPIVPLNDTVAEINLEQLGRTDEETGREVKAFALTGTSYSNLTALIEGAVNQTGVRIYQRKDNDAFFDRSDNWPFAGHGVVDTTIVVAFGYPDYHRPGDTARKIDFQNLAAVDRGIAAAVLELANSPHRPVWTRPRPLLP